MTRTKIVVTAFALSFFVAQLDVLRASLPSAAGASTAPLAGTAMAAGVCPVPKPEQIVGNWRVASTACTNKDCAEPHFAVGDQLRFEQDVSGARNFSLAVTPVKAGSFRARTVGYALRSDGIGNATGSIVLPHHPLDGTPLQLHWLIVKLRAYDADGFGSCRLRARIEICSDEIAPGATQCSDRQHGGVIVADPF